MHSQRTDNTVAKENKTKGQTILYTLHYIEK